MVVLGPGEVEAEGIGAFRGGGSGEQADQFGLALHRVALFAEHRVEAVDQDVPRAGPGVVRDERGPVQRAGAFPLGRGGRGAVHTREILQQRLHHVPRRHLAPVQAGPHAVGVALPEDPAPASALVQACQQTVQIARELPYPTGELIQGHRSAPTRPPALSPAQATPAVLRLCYREFSGSARTAQRGTPAAARTRRLIRPRANTA
ncbi:hypothetical protein M878_08260 [Streptomyces roseochromogenus subsp. oscitans DS 12.976]|uniref:Uncharacterized protein n=1 Tax=Streptomyces roseochromogenus subsp. oscitans DS 12.976 TaxID=1352936 RepID=V6KRU9_STRRC|nr:hypothetical protein M878_08260 [Streptomyces roseochromogenus subsp. oscitans DS 12.976]